MARAGLRAAVSTQMEDAIQASRVLVVDDEPTNVLVLERMFESVGLTQVFGLTDPRRTLQMVNDHAIDLVLLDLHMPHLDGLDVLSELRAAADPHDFLPVLVLTADATTDARDRALDGGANDFLTKPFDRIEALLRVRNLLRLRHLHVEAMSRQEELRAELEAREAESRLAQAHHNEKVARVDRALRGDALSMVFQPIHAVADGSVVGMEALARLAIEPSRAPDIWFREATSVGRGAQLELAAAARALAQIDRLEGFLAVNVSPEVARLPAFTELLSGVDCSRVVVELTEHTRVADEVELERDLAHLRERGVRLAVDDTGAGYAGLQRLLGLAPDIVKLDMALIRGIDHDPARRALATALVAFTSEIGAELIAEGVETDAELSTLRALGVPWVQGFGLGRPAPLPG
ncbi:EAL domain [Euzebya pacifica]|uniref:EAL domain n=1 Tax=Euzebya pacifica TaxID=1608957 RepID=A0A346XWL3_9ACTN|nr:EAL domain-containing response regulator [Euzebya pacifica]AXV06610.1 EAL domain [Euzebya pacifica]